LASRTEVFLTSRRNASRSSQVASRSKSLVASRQSLVKETVARQRALCSLRLWLVKEPVASRSWETVSRQRASRQSLVSKPLRDWLFEEPVASRLPVARVKAVKAALTRARSLVSRATGRGRSCQSRFVGSLVARVSDTSDWRQSGFDTSEPTKRQSGFDTSDWRATGDWLFKEPVLARQRASRQSLVSKPLCRFERLATGSLTSQSLFDKRLATCELQSL